MNWKGQNNKPKDLEDFEGVACGGLSLNTSDDYPKTAYKQTNSALERHYIKKYIDWPPDRRLYSYLLVGETTC